MTSASSRSDRDSLYIQESESYKIGSGYPLWTRTEHFFQPDGTPSRRLVLAVRLRNCILSSFSLAFIFILAIWPLLGLWGRIDIWTCGTTGISQCTLPCAVEPDADIVGIGIRLGTYIQTVCNVLLQGFSSSEHITTTAYSALIITSLAVACSLVGVMWTGFLNFAHAQAARSLMTVMMLPMWIMSRRRPCDPALFLALQVRFMMYNIFIFWITIRCACAGHDPACNLCFKDYWLGVQGSACTPINRSLNLAFAFGTLGSWLWGNVWLRGLGHMMAAIPALFFRRRTHLWVEYIKEHEKHSPLTTSFRFRGRRRTFELQDWPKIRQVVDERAKDHDKLIAFQSGTSRPSFWMKKVLSDVLSAFHAARLWATFTALIVCALAIFNTEKTLAINMGRSMDSWSYGQIFALVATVPSFYSLLQLILRLGRTSEQHICEDCLLENSSEMANYTTHDAASAGTGSGTERWPVYGSPFGRHSW